MNVKKIVQRENKVLRVKAKPVLIKDIKTPKIQKILREMSSALASQSDGVAIAAPQIGYSLRIFVVLGKVFETDFIEENKQKFSGEKTKISIISRTKDIVFVNPKITKLSKDKEWLPEGCLSVRWLYGKAYRCKKATVEAYDENGKKFTRGASGLLAQIFQHETDHLEGVLFVDHAKDIREDNPPK